jgi:microcompartment protein CcmL/EutN
MKPAIALFEYDSIAAGIAAGDAMVKRAPLDGIYAGTVQPGRYLVIVGGSVGAVEEACLEAREAPNAEPAQTVFLPNIDRRIIDRLCGGEAFSGPVESLGILETRRAPAALEAADAGLKGASVELLEIRLSDGIGGKAYVLLAGVHSAVEAAIEIAADRIGAQALVGTKLIPQLHPEMLANLRGESRFGRRLREHQA